MAKITRFSVKVGVQRPSLQFMFAYLSIYKGWEAEDVDIHEAQPMNEYLERRMSKKTSHGTMYGFVVKNQISHKFPLIPWKPKQITINQTP